MLNLFKDHPASVGESYFEHMRAAFGFAVRLLGAACACLVHGLFPFLFTRTGSAMVKRLHDGMVVARHAHGRAVEARRSSGLIAAAGDQT